MGILFSDALMPTDVRAALAEVQSQLQAAQIAASQGVAAAAAADARAANAQQMVTTRDEKLNSASTTAATAAQGVAALQALADSLSGAVTAGNTAHANLQTNIDAETSARTQADVALQAAINLLTARGLNLQIGSLTTTAAVAIGATSAGLPVTWPTAFPDTNGLAVAAPLIVPSGVALSAMTVTVGSVTKTGCTVTVKSNGVLLAAGQIIYVVAYRLGATS